MVCGKKRSVQLLVACTLCLIIFEGEHLTEFYGASLLSCSRVLLGALYSFELEGTVGAPQSVKVLCEEWVLFVFDLLTK